MLHTMAIGWEIKRILFMRVQFGQNPPSKPATGQTRPQTPTPKPPVRPRPESGV